MCECEGSMAEGRLREAVAGEWAPTVAQLGHTYPGPAPQEKKKYRKEKKSIKDESSENPADE